MNKHSFLQLLTVFDNIQYGETFQAQVFKF